MRSQQSAIALLNASVNSLFIASRGKTSQAQNLEDYLPIKEVLAKDDPILLMTEYLGLDCGEAYQAMIENDDIDPNVQKAFKDNDIVFKALERLKNHER